MARQRRRINTMRLDLGELDINSILLGDLRHYVGSPKNYVPKIWDVCMQVLRTENRIILNERDNQDVLDDVWNKFFDDFSESRFRQIVNERTLSVRMDGYRDSVTYFLYDIFVIAYPQVASYVDQRARDDDITEFTNLRCTVKEVIYDSIFDGFDTIDMESAAILTIRDENYLSESLLRREGYGF